MVTPDAFEQPHDIEAERWVLASMISHPAAITVVQETLLPEHFYRPAHQAIYRNIVVMNAGGTPVDPVTLREEMMLNGELKILGPDGPLYLMGLFELGANPVSVTWHARIVLDRALRRRIGEEGHRLVQLASSAADPEETLKQALDRLDHAHAAISPFAGRMTVEGFTRQEDSPPEPVIPGLIDAQDRVVVVAGEGRGKTTLSHQVAFCAAAGVHPFAPSTRIPPQRVLLVDLENPTANLRRRFIRMAELAAQWGDYDPERIMVHHAPAGLNLTSAREAFRLAEVIHDARPSLVVAGPVYKMLTGTTLEMIRAHERLTAFFDRIRSRYGCAVWLEAHAPYGEGGRNREMRPEGSAIWARWPEFGLSLYPATKAHGGPDGLDVRQFRGHREEGRSWPSWLTRNPHAGWPWVANYDRATVQEPLPEEGR